MEHRFHSSLLSLVLVLLSLSSLTVGQQTVFRATPSSSSSSSCGLIVTGPPRSSSFDQASAVFGGKGQTNGGSSTCVTLEAVNAAFEQAMRNQRLTRPRPGGEFNTDAVGSLGTVIHETSRILAKQYGLSKDAVANGLPLIDTTKTVIERYCPPFLMTPRCEVQRYRSVSGSCNNLKNPHWGAAMHGHHRFLPPDYADGISAPRASVTGFALPSARLVSTNVHKGSERHDHAVTMLLVAWGQYIDHDLTLNAEVEDPVTKKAPKCCQGSRHPSCLPIEIPPFDPFFRKFGEKCMNFVRSHAGLRHNCRLGPRNSFNRISSFIDSGTTYANTESKMHELREFRGGKLKMLPLFGNKRMKELLPLKLEEPDAGCIRPSADVYCFLAGDPRVNEQTVLAMVHTLFAREHNRVAEELERINPHWSDETLFQETRHIVVALQQQITFNEFLPMVLGREVMESHNLMLLKDGYLNEYDDSINPSVATVFATAAFRFGHSLLPSEIERWSKSHRYVASQKLSRLLNQPYDLYKEGWADHYLHGLVNQVAQAMDDSVSTQVTNHLFEEPGKPFGLDLAALNIQRGREHGIPGYNAWREWCNLPRARSFDDLNAWMPNSTVNAYRLTYSSVDDIDIWSAGISERPLPGSMVGPVFACIIGKQFHNFRFGDRFWYENGGWPSSFTLEQLAEIRKVKMSRILCDNSDEMDHMQVYAMVLPDHEINPRVPCKSGVLRSMDLTKWRDATFHTPPTNNFFAQG